MEASKIHLLFRCCLRGVAAEPCTGAGAAGGGTTRPFRRARRAGCTSRPRTAPPAPPRFLYYNLVSLSDVKLYT